MFKKNWTCPDVDAADTIRGKESDHHPNPTTNSNPNPYLVAVRYGSLANTRCRYQDLHPIIA